MAITVTKGLVDLHQLFNSVDEIYFKKSELTTTALASALTFDLELPVLSEGVTFDTGQPEVTQINLTTGTMWTTRAVRGETDISFQVATMSADVNDLFLTKIKDIAATENLIDSVSLAGGAYSLAPKKAVGSLTMFSEDKSSVIVLPNIEVYANLVLADGENPAYFNLSVTPRENSEAADIFILTEEAAGE